MMAKAVTNVFAQNHRRQQFMTLGVAAVLMLLALIPRNERAMFVLSPVPVETPKVFAAIIPPIGYLPVNPFYSSDRTRRLTRVPFAPVAPTAGVPEAVAPGGGAPSTDFGPPAAESLPFGNGPGFVPASAMGEPAGPFFGGSSPAAPEPPIGGIGPIMPIAPVPEPASWAMMIAGFSIVGALLRRRRSVRLAESEHAVTN